MIVYAEGSELVVFTQCDHAHFAAELLSLWRADGLPEHPRRAALLRAVREHDNGWREADAAPRVDRESGRPHDFLTLPATERCELWRRGTRRFLGDDPYVALLILHHARWLHRERRHEPPYDELLSELDELYDELLVAAELAADVVAADYRFLDLSDLLSLVVTNRWQEPFERRGLRGDLAVAEAASGKPVDTLRLAPLPLAGSTTFTLPCRRIPDRRYAGDADLGVELATARWRQRRVRVTALEA